MENRGIGRQRQGQHHRPQAWSEAANLFWWETTYQDLHLGFTSAAAGNFALSHPGGAADNRRRLENYLGLPSTSLRFLRQVHSAEVIDADQTPSQGEEAPIGDAWVSSGGTPLAIMVGDCLPVLFAAQAPDPLQPVLMAAAHAGRPGLLSGVLENTVAALEERGGRQLTAWIGPGACGDCYEVPQQMVEDVAANRPALRSYTRWGTPALNLRAEAVRLLEERDVDVVDIASCTIEEDDLFSHRRSGRTGEVEGRLVGVIHPASV